jgi:hypothetical protein
MGRTANLEPHEIFKANLEDAEALLLWATALRDTRKNHMRKELRQAFGKMRRLSRADTARLDCAESGDLFIVIKPDSVVDRKNFELSALAPLLRQAIVATSAAVEGYVFAKTRPYLGEALDEAVEYILRPRPGQKKPAQVKYLEGLTFNVMQALEIDEGRKRGKRQRWVFREHVREHLRVRSSTAPGVIGEAFSTVGKKLNWKTIDKGRGLKATSSGKAQSYVDMGKLTKRRNAIAHQQDRRHVVQRSIRLSEVREHLENAREIVAEIEKQLP